jgi:hypothetical protein
MLAPKSDYGYSRQTKTGDYVKGYKKGYADGIKVCFIKLHSITGIVLFQTLQFLFLECQHLFTTRNQPFIFI